MIGCELITIKCWVRNHIFTFSSYVRLCCQITLTINYTLLYTHNTLALQLVVQHTSISSTTTCLEAILIVKLASDINCVRRMTQNAYTCTLIIVNQCPSDVETLIRAMWGTTCRYSSTHPLSD